MNIDNQTKTSVRNRQLKIMIQIRQRCLNDNPRLNLGRSTWQSNEEETAWDAFLKSEVKDKSWAAEICNGWRMEVRTTRKYLPVIWMSGEQSNDVRPMTKSIIIHKCSIFNSSVQTSDLDHHHNWSHTTTGLVWLLLGGGGTLTRSRGFKLRDIQESTQAHA